MDNGVNDVDSYDDNGQSVMVMDRETHISTQRQIEDMH